MYRMPQNIDPAEERKKVRAGVNGNLYTFVILCAAIRLAPYLLNKIGSN